MAEVMLITGTRKGIGRYLVDYYLKQGYTVVGCSRSPMDEVIDGYTHHALDVSDEKAVQRMVRDTVKVHGGLDAVVNNAGIAAMNHILLTPLSTVQNIFATNYFGTFNCCREAAKAMMLKRKGRIINFTTVAHPLNLEGEAAYAASKAAVESLTRIMAKEVGSYNITVNAIGPTPIDTDLIRGVPPEKLDALLNTQALKRLGQFEDVTNCIDFFLNERSDFVTGQVLYLGGVSR